jgi:hypothetical protein
MQMGNFDEAETLLVEALNKARLFHIEYVTYSVIPFQFHMIKLLILHLVFSYRRLFVV